MKVLFIALATAILAVPTASAHTPYRGKWWKGLHLKEIAHKQEKLLAHNIRASKHGNTAAVRAWHKKATKWQARELEKTRDAIAAFAAAEAARRAAMYSGSSGYETSGSYDGSSTVTSGGTGACGSACIQCESGGNPQAVSADGTYWGLYQFDRQSWVAHGGNPATYGSASAAEQTAVAANVSSDIWPNC